jgi:hypothetical protein
VASADHLSSRVEHDGADWYVAGGQSMGRLFDGLPHRLLVSLVDNHLAAPPVDNDPDYTSSRHQPARVAHTVRGLR